MLHAGEARNLSQIFPVNLLLEMLVSVLYRLNECFIVGDLRCSCQPPLQIKVALALLV